MPALIPESVPDIRYYVNREGELTPMIAGSFPEAATHPPLLLGVKIDDHVHPIFDHRLRWIMVDLNTYEIIPMTLNLYRIHRYDFPVHILDRLKINNNGEFVMPLNVYPNEQQIQPRNVRRRHN